MEKCWEGYLWKSKDVPCEASRCTEAVSVTVYGDVSEDEATQRQEQIWNQDTAARGGAGTQQAVKE